MDLCSPHPSTSLEDADKQPSKKRMHGGRHLLYFASNGMDKKTMPMNKKTMRGILLSLLLASGALCYAPSAAEQLHFDKEEKGKKIVFSYIYQDSVKRREEIDFALPRKAIEASQALLLDNAALDRAASDFILLEGQETAAKYLVALQAGFDAGIATLQTSIATFNGRLGSKAVSMTLQEPSKLDLKLQLAGENLLDIRVSSLLPGMSFARNTDDLLKKFYADLETIVALANATLPEGLRFRVIREAGSVRFPLKNEKRSYDTGTRARAAQTISETNARLRSRTARHKSDVVEVRKFDEGSREHARALLAETSERLSLARKEVIADMKIKKSQFYALHYLLPSKKEEDRTLIDYARIATQARERLRPVARAFRATFKGKSERERVSEVLRFFQNIPYNDLTQGKVRGFVGFSPPLEMLAQNLGDCDSKSTAMMGLLGLLAEDRSVALFLVPKHAFLGVEMQPLEGEASYTHQGKTYVLMEPTGPRVRPLGSLLQSSFEHLQAGRIDDIITLPSR